MFKEEKVVSLVLALALIAGMFGCAGQTSEKTESGVSSDRISSVESVSNTTVSENDWFEDSNFTTQYTRKYLSENEITDSDIFSASEEWAIMLFWNVLGQCSPYDVDWNYIKGSCTLYPVFSNCEDLFDVMGYFFQFSAKGSPKGLTADENGIYGFYVQVVMKEMEGTRVSLLGFVTNQTRKINRPSELAQFLKVIPRYENLAVSEPITPANVKAIDLTELTGGLFVQDVYPTNDLLYVFGYDPNSKLSEKIKTELLLKVYSSENLQFLYEESFTCSVYSPCLVSSDDNTIVFSLDDIALNTEYFCAAETGVTKLSSVPDSANGIYPLSDTATIREDGEGGLILDKDGQTVQIFTGIPYTEDMGEDPVGYYFRYRLDDISFVYTKTGYECFYETGVYNIETGQSLLITHKNTEELFPVSSSDGKVVLAPYDWSSYTSFGPYVYDNSNGQVTDLGWFYAAFTDDYLPSFKLYKDTLAAFWENDSGFSIRICNLKTNNEPKTYEITGCAGISISVTYAETDGFWVTSTPRSLSDYYIFQIRTES